MTDSFFEEKLDGFRVEVIDRLARIETKHDQVIERIERLNGTAKTHGVRIAEHDRHFARIRGMGSVIAAIVAAAISFLVPKLRAWFNL
jgi:prephenate dehydrogenase